MKLRLIALFVVLAAMVVSVNVAGAGRSGPPPQVTIVSPITLADPFNFGTFTATGPAAESGLICSTGTVVDTFLIYKGYQSGKGYNVLVTKTFTCDDESGTFFVRLAAQSRNGTETFNWVVQGGTGSYASLRGRGDGSTVPTDDGGINTYTGFLTGK